MELKSLLLLASFFIIIIFMFTSFLCAHFCRRRRFSSPPPPSTQVAAQVEVSYYYATHNSMHLSSSITSGSDKKSLGFVYEGIDERKECCICLSIFQEDEKVKVLRKCRHVYHSQCLDQWLNVQPSCPVCRTTLKV